MLAYIFQKEKPTMMRLPRWLGTILLLLFLVALSTEPVVPQTVITVQLLPVNGSNVHGTASLTALGQGTAISLQVVGLAGGTSAYAALYGGSCTQPGASVARLPALVAAASDQVSATGSILFRGTEAVALTAIADGDHSIAITGPNGVEACGVIPNLQEAQGVQLPTTGVGMPPLLTGVAIGAALLAIGGCLWLKARPR